MTTLKKKKHVSINEFLAGCLLACLFVLFVAAMIFTPRKRLI